jgi:hypothetical protein
MKTLANYADFTESCFRIYVPADLYLPEEHQRVAGSWFVM